MGYKQSLFSNKNKHILKMFSDQEGVLAIQVRIPHFSHKFVSKNIFEIIISFECIYVRIPFIGVGLKRLFSRKDAKRGI